MTMADLQTKYQKLAGEYSKLRAQVPVLKKAVIDEQEKEETLKETIKERDQSIRKYTQEIESLTFRNQQLAARISVLQNDLDDMQSKGKKSKKHTTNQSHANSSGDNVIGEELQSKIEENARLHKQVYEADTEHRQTIMQLQDRLTILEGEAGRHQEVVENTSKRNAKIIEKLQEEKAMLEVKLQRQESDVKEAQSRAQSAEEQLTSIEEDLSSRLTEATKIIKDKLQFNDTKIRELNALNIPTHDRKHQLRAKELVSQAATLLKELTQGLSNFHTYCEQRSRIYPVDGDCEPLSDVNKKLCGFLHENASLLRPVEQAFKAFYEEMKEESLTTLETATGLQEFASKFNKYVTYATKLLPYHLLSIEEECAVSTCTTTLESKNMELHESLKKFIASLTRVDTYITILAKQSSPECDHPKTSHRKLLEQLSRSLLDFHENIKDVSKHYNAKVSLEHQLPTATQKLKTTDECIVSSLVSLVTCSSKLSAFYVGNLDFFSAASGYRTRGSSVSTSGSQDGPKAHPAVNTFRQRASAYMSNISKPCPESVHYSTAVQNRKRLLSSTESRDSLAQQVVTFQDRLTRLDQDKEHWMLESQLLQIKHEKEIQKVAELQKKNKMLQARISGSIEDNLELNNIDKKVNQTGSGAAGPVVETSMLGLIETTSIPESDAETREQLIKKHFSLRITELTSKLQIADSKALNFQAECRALHKQLVISKRQKDRFQEEISVATQTIAQLKDELQTTTRNYEGQLSMMSEHLAGMNEKLTTQKDEIDNLRYQLQMVNSKSGKKGKGK